jgi:hypothetical protein
MSCITRPQQRLSDRAHVGGDAFASQAGWTITRTTGQFGFGARVYRDPRFDQQRRRFAATGEESGRASRDHRRRGARLNDQPVSTSASTTCTPLRYSSGADTEAEAG